ncbi:MULTISPECIES: hypothetical protein [Streptococcus]|jgi:hypothetical protein|uniref:hypothetical protein n=1 Tax=Streptococcus TaxID=1301 RepID=UPI00065FE09C|nr:MULTISPECIES: hypothetical protein [Streptococcus]
MDKNKRSIILKSRAFLTALVATGLVNNGVSADETAAPTGPTDNATVATGHSDTLLPPASSTPATPGTNSTDVPTAEAPKVDTPKNEGVTTETPKVTDGSTGTGVATPTTPSVTTPSQDEGKTLETSVATPTTSENASTTAETSTATSEGSEGNSTSDTTSTASETPTPSEHTVTETPTNTPHILGGTNGTGVSTPSEHKSDNRTEVASPSAATSNKVVESPKTEETPKVSDTNVQEAPKPGDVSPSTKQVVLNVTPSQPVVTNTGYKVFSTNNSDLVVQNFDGSVASVPASQAGGAVNEDGTVSVKTEAGEMVTLPETGEAGTKLVTFGFLILAALGLQRTAVKQDKWYSN